MKQINIQSLLQAKDALEKDDFSVFLTFYGIEIKDAEIEDLRNLTNALGGTKCNIGLLDKFYVGYKIPQIGKEFDLLRFCKESIVNVELKSESSEEKIKKQLIRNKYYLNFIGRKVYAFTFVSESNELYFLRDDEQLEKVKIDDLVKQLNAQKMSDIEVIDELFNPSDYLVSPFNSTKSFLADEYFLTQQQESAKNKIIDSIESLKTERFFSIVGSAGTGKTLLTYDIAKSLIKMNKKSLVIHCGQLNDGHAVLNKNGWLIIPVKDYKKYDLKSYELVVIDEAQRIYPSQLDDLIEKVKIAKCCCIFSHDKRQTLASWEEDRGVSAKIDSIDLIEKFKLSEKVRTNKEIATFIKMLFNSKTPMNVSSNGNIEINYFNTAQSAKDYFDALDKTKWEILRFTPSQYSEENHQKYFEISSHTSHKVIGQEFNGVAVAIDEFFSYDCNGNLVYKGKTYYDPVKMLFQNMTRTRKKLNLIIIGNQELLNRCITILQ